jgi:hypothetical protein
MFLLASGFNASPESLSIKAVLREDPYGFSC